MGYSVHHWFIKSTFDPDVRSLEASAATNP